MTWGIVILLVRGLASIVGALAGIAALLSDGALAKRQQPAKGFWKGTPFEHRRITRWGAVLLSVIIFAPVTQFCGDVLKDMNSDKQLRSTTDDIKKSISSEVSQSTTRLESQVGSAIEKSDTQLVKAVGNSTSELKSNVESVVDKSVGEASGKIVGLFL